MIDPQAIKQYPPSIETIKSRAKLGQADRQVEPPLRWQDVWLDSLVASGRILERLIALAPPSPYHSALNRAGYTSMPATVHDALLEERHWETERQGDGGLNEAWRSVIALGRNADEQRVLTLERQQRYVWAVVGPTILSHITGIPDVCSLDTDNITIKERDPHWVGAIPVRSSVDWLLAGKFTDLVESTVLHITRPCDDEQDSTTFIARFEPVETIAAIERAVTRYHNNQ